MNAGKDAEDIPEKFVQSDKEELEMRMNEVMLFMDLC